MFRALVLKREACIREILCPSLCTARSRISSLRIYIPSCHAICDPYTHFLGSMLWCIDYERQISRKITSLRGLICSCSFCMPVIPLISIHIDLLGDEILQLSLGKSVKVKFSLRHKDVWGSGCVDPLFLDLGTIWRWVVSFTVLPLYPGGKSPRYPLDRRLGGPHSRSGRFGEEKILDPTGTRSSSPLPVAIPTELSRRLLGKSILFLTYQTCEHQALDMLNITLHIITISLKTLSDSL
jgi:hypothetical protein